MNTKILGGDIKPGNVLRINNCLMLVRKIDHVRTGKGGGYVTAELKNVKTNSKDNRRFRSSESLEQVQIEERSYQFLYRENGPNEASSFFIFMNCETFEQISASVSLLEKRQEPFLKEGLLVRLGVCEGEAIQIFLPERAVFTVLEADPVLKHHTITSSYKTAVLDNNVKIQVPPYVESGMKILINPQTCEYIERIKAL